MLKSLRKHLSIGTRAWLLVLAGSVVWSLAMVKSGLLSEYGVGFWGPNGHDGVWHVSLARALASGSFEMPIFAGEAIKNYHVGFDLLLAGLHKITNIPISVLYFQIFPPVMALLIGLLTYKFVLNWKKSESAALWSTFFVYFAGNLGWVVTMLRSGEVGGETMFWAQPAALTLVNPPFALSLVVILGGLIAIQRQRKLSISILLLSILLFGVLVQVKAYAGIVVLGALLIASVYEFIKRKKMNYFKIFLGSVIISFVIFLPNFNSGSLLEFKPFWFLETMMTFPDRLGWVRFGEAMVNYRLGGSVVRAFAAYGLALAIFWYGNVGTRFINEFYWVSFFRNKKKLELLDIFLGSAILIGFVSAMLFVQKGTAWNTIQFFYYSLFFTSILSGIVFAGILEKAKNTRVKTIFVMGMVVFTLPTTLGVLKHYLPPRPPAMVPNYELEALEFLSTQPKGTTVVMPFDREAAQAAVENPPRPLYLYESTAYVSAYSGQSVWLEDEVNLDITGYDWRARRERLLEVLGSGGEELDKFLKEENISYVYVINESEYSEAFFGFEKIFENEMVSVLSARGSQLYR